MNNLGKKRRTPDELKAMEDELTDLAKERFLFELNQCEEGRRDFRFYLTLECDGGAKPVSFVGWVEPLNDDAVCGEGPCLVVVNPLQRSKEKAETSWLGSNSEKLWGRGTRDAVFAIWLTARDHGENITAEVSLEYRARHPAPAMFCVV